MTINQSINQLRTPLSKHEKFVILLKCLIFSKASRITKVRSYTTNFDLFSLFCGVVVV
jgi:hypothetical protein